MAGVSVHLKQVDYRLGSTFLCPVLAVVQTNLAEVKPEIYVGCPLMLPKDGAKAQLLNLS
jgi:hypothetical protein